MRDPYQVLGVPNTATDDEIKTAYRNLARKYHPDNYQDNPLADLAQEKMKEINEAYETIQSQRKGHGSGGTSYGGSGYQSGYTGYSGTAGGTSNHRVRAAITQGNLNLAEELLNAETDHDAEWHFLKGTVCYRRGWLDEARRYFETAVQMDPGNAEYRYALRVLNGNESPYQPDGYRAMTTTGCGNEALGRICGTLLCINCLSGGGYYFCC